MPMQRYSDQQAPINSIYIKAFCSSFLFQKACGAKTRPFWKAHIAARFGVIRIVVSDGTILGNLDPGAKPISPPCKGGRGDFGTASFGTTNRITIETILKFPPLAKELSQKVRVC
jgi:hypothetical protein